jgi:hypothetical protein
MTVSNIFLTGHEANNILAVLWSKQRLNHPVVCVAGMSSGSYLPDICSPVTSDALPHDIQLTVHPAVPSHAPKYPTQATHLGNTL